MADDVTIGLGGDARDLEREFKRIQREVDRLKDKLAKVGRESKKGARDAKKMKTGFTGVAGPVKQIAGMLGVGGVIATGISYATNRIEKWHTNMQKIADNTRKAGQNMVAFALMQEPGKKGERTRKTAAWGAQYGMDTGESWATVQALQAQYGNYKKGMKAAEYMGRLIQMGTPVESAKDVVSLAKGLGEGAGGFARQVYRTGEFSAKEVALIASKVGKGLPDWGGIKGGATSGLAGMAVLSEIYKEELGTMTKALSLSLTQKAPWKKMGYKGALGDPEAQFAFLQEKGILSTVQLKNVGFGEQRQRTALSIVARKAERYKEAYGEIGAVRGREGYLEKLRAETEAEVPEMKFTRVTGMAEKMREAYKTLGPEGKEAMLYKLRQEIMGSYLTATGRSERMPTSAAGLGGWEAIKATEWAKGSPWQEEHEAAAGKRGYRIQDYGLFEKSPYKELPSITEISKFEQMLLELKVISGYMAKQLEGKEHDKKSNDFSMQENHIGDEN